MSLLLDALKRAEEAKRAKLSAERGDAPVPAAPESRVVGVEPSAIDATNVAHAPQPDVGELRLADYEDEPPAPRSPIEKGRSEPGNRSPFPGRELSLEQMPIDSIGAPRLSAETPVPRTMPATKGAPVADRETAKSVFVAKQTMSADSASGRKWLLPALAVGITVVGGGGWYVWSELNRISKPAAMANRPATPVMPQPAAISPTVPPQPTTAATPPEPPAVVAEAPLPPLLPPAIDQPSVPVPSAAVAAGIARGLDEREALAKALKQIPPSGDAPVTLKLTRSIAPTAVSTELSAAYQSLKEGNYAVAVTRYSNLVQSEPLNTDAHLGLATAFARNGDAVAAARHFRAVLAIDPRNTSAIAGLMSINRTGPESTEVEIKTLLSKFPESAALHFALGNRLASDRRWVEAQQAYFEAYRLDATRADYVYNLAVSLDQLGKQILARDYYSKALAMPVDAGGQFDKAVVARRLRELAVASER